MQLKWPVLLSYLAVYVIWGSTYFFIGIAVKEIPPAWMLALRFLSAGAFLTLVPLLSRRAAPPTWPQVGKSALLGLLLLVMGNGFVTIGEMTVDSYLAALVLSGVPFVVALYNRVLFGQSQPWIKLAGISLGIAGLALVLWDPGHPLGLPDAGIFWIFGAIAAWGLGTSVSSRLAPHPDPWVNTGLQMLTAGSLSLAWALIDSPQALVLQPPGWASLLSLTYLAVFGTLGILAYNYLLKHEPSFRITSYALVNPLIAVLLGLGIGAETPTPFLAWGLPLSLVGLTLMLYGPALLARLHSKNVKK